MKERMIERKKEIIKKGGESRNKRGEDKKNKRKN